MAGGKKQREARRRSHELFRDIQAPTVSRQSRTVLDISESDEDTRSISFEKVKHTPHRARQLVEVVEVLESDSDSSESSETEVEEQRLKKQRTKAIRTTIKQRKDTYSNRESVGKKPNYVKSAKQGNREVNANKSEAAAKVKLSKYRAKIEGFKEILKLFENAQGGLESLGDTAEFKAWLKDSKTADQEGIKSLGGVCSEIAMFIQDYQKSRSSEKSYMTSETHFWHRTRDNQIEHLMVMKRFKGIREVQKKTFGFVRIVGTQDPLKYAISGWERSAEDDPEGKLLSTRDYNEKVLKFCEIFDHKMKKGREVTRRTTEVTEEGGHVEKLLMMYYALHVLRSRTGNAAEIEDLAKLDKLRPHPRAEIVVSWKPCEECDLFRQRLNEVTGIGFDFYRTKNLGRIKKVRKANSSDNMFPRDPPDTTDEEGETEFFRPKRKTKSIVIGGQVTAKSGKTAAKKRKREGNNYESEDSDSGSEYMIPRTPKKSVTRRKGLVTELPTPPRTPQTTIAVILPKENNIISESSQNKRLRTTGTSNLQQRLHMFAYRP